MDSSTPNSQAPDSNNQIIGAQPIPVQLQVVQQVNPVLVDPPQQPVVNLQAVVSAAAGMNPQPTVPVVPIMNQAVAAPMQQVAPIQQPSQPVSGGHKEFAPIGGQSAAEFLKPADVMETRPEISPEVHDAGVEHAVETEKLELTEEHKQAGIELAKESTPMIPIQPTIPAPMLPHAPFQAEPEAVKVAQATKAEDQKHWLALLFVAVMKKLRLRQQDQLAHLPAEDQSNQIQI